MKYPIKNLLLICIIVILVTISGYFLFSILLKGGEGKTLFYKYNFVPNQSKILIKNVDNATCDFYLHSDNSFFGTKDEIINEINDIKQKQPDVPLERIAWSYVIKKIKFGTSYTLERWQHSPELLFNSIGNGQCDDLASVLAFIWKDLGFESRVWTLNGHVVPEVLVNDKWQMYDPSYQVYYLNYNNEVASVPEISDDFTIIINRAITYDHKISLSQLLSNSNYLANLYTTKADNSLNSWYSEEIDTLELRFSLPSQSSLEFPLNVPELSKKYTGASFPDYSFAIIKIPDAEECSLRIPLVIYKVKGSGEILIGTKKFNIGSDELNKYIQTTDVFINEVTFPGNHKNIYLYYLINKKSICDITYISLKSKDINRLKVTIIPDKSSSEIYSINIDSVINKNYRAYLLNKTRINKNFNIKFKENLLAEVKNRIEEIISSDNSVSVTERSQRSHKINSQLDSLSMELGKENSEIFFKSIYYPETIVLFMSYAEYLNTIEFVNIVNNQHN